ncbi:Hypothetical predicted protein [Mytilus galloprovincialis]|uniref:LRRNT domain-containing protein n=1 Tax=Mytilus galloprovincialis TaxID=29158 RepID=A0A8B6HQY7_MYTGA|nr:Hypothetical predicted protein [Mytilus galloprovincialis]
MQTTDNDGVIDIPCPTPICICQDRQLYHEAICSGEYIPRMPARVTQITFMNGQIKVLSGITMANLTISSITMLNFSNNGIQKMEADALSHVTTIVQLDICNLEAD